MLQKKAQISTEYLIVIIFVTFVIISILGTALFYSSQIRDTIKFNQLERFANKLSSSAESVFYSGAPALTTITTYVPEGVNSIDISGNDITFEVSTSSGLTKISYTSNVVLEGTLSPSPGVKKLKLSAETDKVTITQE